MATIKAKQSETLWYILLTVAAATVASLLVDPKFTAELGTYGLLGLYILDKIIHAGLRMTTTKAIEPPAISKPKKEKHLDPIKDAFRRDAEDNDLV